MRDIERKKILFLILLFLRYSRLDLFINLFLALITPKTALKKIIFFATFFL